jgi:hypothetical protein
LSLKYKWCTMLFTWIKIQAISLIFFFWDRILWYKPSLSWTWDPSVSASWTLEITCLANFLWFN